MQYADQPTELLDQRLLIASKFIVRLLGRQAPFESTPEVLDYLVSEADALLQRETYEEELRSGRQDLISKVEAQCEDIRGALANCGIDDEDDKFGSVLVACSFASLETAPVVDSLIRAYMSQVIRLQEARESHERLAYRCQSIEDEIDQVLNCRLSLPDEILFRLTEDTSQRKIATKTITERADQDRHGHSSLIVPSMDIGYVMQQQAALDKATDHLLERESYLTSLKALPPDLETVQLESDRLQRQLNHLEQQRKDLFRGFRH